jgi:radical SAM protein with 4Fe4S-binding SPASM domain
MKRELNKLYQKLREIEVLRQSLNISFIKYYARALRTLVFRQYFLKTGYLYSSHGFVSLNIETIGICNRKCDFCFFHERFPKRESGIMSEKTYKRIIDDLSTIKFKGRISPHSYGEPLLDRRLPMLMEYTRKKLPNCFIEISTNGDLLTAELFNKLIAKGVDYFIITNYDDEEKPYLKFISEKYPYYVYLRNYKDFKKIDKAGRIFNKKLQYDIPCLQPSNQLVVNWKGDVVLCCCDFYGEYVMGNVNDSKLLDIYNSRKYLYYKNNLIKGQRSSIPICKHCDFS